MENFRKIQKKINRIPWKDYTGENFLRCLQNTNIIIKNNFFKLLFKFSTNLLSQGDGTTWEIHLETRLSEKVVLPYHIQL